jgi:hypothetical protein
MTFKWCRRSGQDGSYPRRDSDAGPAKYEPRVRTINNAIQLIYYRTVPFFVCLHKNKFPKLLKRFYGPNFAKAKFSAGCLDLKRMKR